MKKIIVCVNFRANPDQPSCAARGSVALARRIEEEAARQTSPAVAVERVDCLGHCEQGPNVRLIPNGRFFHYFDDRDVPLLLAEAARECEGDCAGDV